MVAGAQHLGAFYCWPRAAVLADLGADFLFGGATPQEENRRSPAVRIFRKPSSPPFLPERTMSPEKMGSSLPLERVPGKEAAPSPRYLPTYRQLTRKLSFCSPPASGLLGVDLAFPCESENPCACPPLTLRHLSPFPTARLQVATNTGFWQPGGSQSQRGKASDI